MATTARKAPAAKKPAKKTMVAKFPDPPDKGKADAMARMALRPSVNAAVVMAEFLKPLGEQDVSALVDALAGGIDDVWAGDTKRAEAMLYSQAHALQAIFMNLARRASLNMGEYMHAAEAYMRLALKAQGQCRATLETLAAIKNPPVVIARQANINNGGQQQVNNGAAVVNPISTRAPVHAGAHAANSEVVQTELLEGSDGERLDARAAGEAGSSDSQLEAVGAVHRTAHR